ncbi:MAG: FHIPEP family type III secretion protein [Deltaproteobacteria bacterium]|nr:FHIPEP family type III secretion protein [Deltaproteobacteria bacterium]
MKFTSSTASDLLLPLAVVSVVAMMIFPLPPAVLDSLLVCNITFSLLLLITSVYLSEPERFTSLPSVLLLTTLFRLGLNISTTRQILSGGDAPSIVAAFGHFVVGGNLVVGCVVFIILTIIQFLVISKGAERVAEVAARFTLDAMPGKQMAIDAELRAGALSLSEAKIRRQDLQREAKLYGALDGAMKFVKGDAIAGLLITTLNISAGIILGVLQQNLSFSDSVARYSLLTIGDGLVSQIPALLVAVAAAIAITRVRDIEDTFIGRDLARQLSQEPRVFIITGALLGALSIVPELPTFPFLFLAILSVIYAAKGHYRKEHHIEEVETQGFRPKIYSPLLVKVTPRLTFDLQQKGNIVGDISQLREKIFVTWGVLIPEPQLEIDNDPERTIASFYLNSCHIEDLDYNNIAPFSPLSVADVFVKRLENFLTDHLVEFINDTHTRTLLEAHLSICEDLVNNVVPDIISVTGLTNILKQLLTEKIPIRELATILQAIANHKYMIDSNSPNDTLIVQVNEPASNDTSGTNRPPMKMRETLATVRQALARTITRQIKNGSNEIDVYTLDNRLNRVLCLAALTGNSLLPEFHHELIEKLAELVDNNTGEQVIIMTSTYARSYLAKLIAEQFPVIRVVAATEILTAVKINVLEKIKLGATLQLGSEEIDDSLDSIKDAA